MPSLGLWSWLSWLASIAGQFAVICLLWRTGWRRFPSVLAFACVRICVDLALIGISLYTVEPHRSWWYFYVYYAGSALTAVTELGIICELSSQLFLSQEMRHTVRTTLTYTAGGYLIGASLFSFLSPLPFDERMYRFCVALSRATSLAWLAVFLCVVFLVRWLSLIWTADALGIAIGYAVASVGEVGASWLLGIIRTQFLSDMQTVFYLACLATWIFTLSSARPRRLCPAVNQLGTL